MLTEVFLVFVIFAAKTHYGHKNTHFWLLVNHCWPVLVCSCIMDEILKNMCKTLVKEMRNKHHILLAIYARAGVTHLP